MNKSFLVVTLSLLGMLSGLYYYQSVVSDKNHRGVDVQMRMLYTQWKAKYGRLYSTPNEDGYRMNVFANQKVLIDEYNTDYEAKFIAATGRSLTEPTFELNLFSDLTEEEFVAKYTGDTSLEESTEIEQEEEQGENREELPEAQAADQTLAKSLGASYDIRVRNQGSCGSCWAFASIASVEKLHFDQTGQRLDLSQQELVDCNTQSSGCNGGSTVTVFEYIAKNGISTASQYPYRKAQESCKRSSINGRISPKVQYPKQLSFTTSYLASYISKGYHPYANLYSSGKFKSVSRSEEPFRADLSGECQKMKNHAIAIVAYSSSQGAKILNSWGTGWGLNGMKNVIPCSSSVLLGAGGRLAHPYAS